MITKFAMASDISNVLSQFSSHAAKPENFLSVQSAESLKFRKCTKTLYDFTKTSESSSLAGDALPELIIDQFDDEQVWQEIELQNEPSVSYLLKHIATVASQSRLSFIPKSTNTSQPEEKPISSKIKKSVKFIAEENEKETEDLSDLETEEKLKDTKSFFDDIDSDDESEEEKELKAALERATAAPEAEDDDDDDDEDNENDKNKDDENSDNDDINSDSDFDLDISSKKSGKKSTESSETKTVKKRKTEVDDKFFKMADMETFLDQEDAREEKRRRVTKEEESDSDEESDEEEEIDWFAKMSDEEDQEQGSDENDSKEQKYGDFFDPPEGEEKQRKKKKPKDKSVESVEDPEIEDDQEDNDDQEKDENVDDDSSSSDEDSDDGKPVKAEKKSSFEVRQERLKERISDLESKSIGDKPWQLSGEIAATARPENSLLQEHLDFEHTTNTAPVITEETTKTLESIIIQRIKDKAWDDVERKTKKVEQPFEYKKRVVLDQEKSKIGLGEVYEQEFLKQMQGEEEEKNDPQHEGIQKMMQSLFLKLDALSNFHFTPKQAAPEVKIVSNLPSIAMEEVAPVAVADANRLAPEEVLEKSKGELKGASEATSTDKKRARREKKLKQRTRKIEQEKRLMLVSKMNPVLGDKYSKRKALEDVKKQSLSAKSGVSFMKEDSTKNKGLTSSTKFFSQLQEEVKTGVGEKKVKQKLRKDNKRKQTSSTKLKL